jgi:hypothetical protein
MQIVWKFIIYTISLRVTRNHSFQFVPSGAYTYNISYHSHLISTMPSLIPKSREGFVFCVDYGSKVIMTTTQQPICNGNRVSVIYYYYYCYYYYMSPSLCSLIAMKQEKQYMIQALQTRPLHGANPQVDQPPVPLSTTLPKT